MGILTSMKGCGYLELQLFKENIAMLMVRPSSKTQGFTLLELLTSLAIMGIAVAIATPSYLGWANHQRLKAANEQVYRVLYRARDRAVHQNLAQQVSFREIGNRVEWAIHPTTQPAISWTALPPEVKLDAETTLRRQQGTYIVQFNDYGEVNGQLGRVTLSLASSPKEKQCLMISTLLGKLRQGENHRKPQNDRYCY
jgi:prepilin-type N-terminal cleavage/methylation domain-containing protein